MYPYNPGDIIDMPEYLVRGQNAPYVEILKDQKTPVTNFQQQEMETTVIMGAPDEKDRVTKKIPEPKEYSKVVQLEDVPEAGRNQKVAETTTIVTTGGEAAEEAKVDEEVQEQAFKDALKATRIEELAQFNMSNELIEQLNLGELTEDEFHEVITKAEQETKKLADQITKNEESTNTKEAKSK